VALLIADRAKLMEEIEVLRKLKFSNGVNGMNKEGDLLSEVIKVSSNFTVNSCLLVLVCTVLRAYYFHRQIRPQAKKREVNFKFWLRRNGGWGLVIPPM
jgi:hypothetical protein